MKLTTIDLCTLDPDASSLWDAFDQYGGGIYTKSYYLSHLRSINKPLPVCLYISKDEIVSELFTLLRSQITMKFFMGEVAIFSRLFRALVGVNNIFAFPKTILANMDFSQLINEYNAEVLRVNSVPIQYLNDVKKLQVSSKLIRYIPYSPYNRYFISIKGKFENYLDTFSGKTKSTLKRKVNKLRKACQGGLRFVPYEDSNRIEEFLDSATILSKKTYQHRLLGLGLNDSRGFREHVRYLAEHEAVKGYLLFDGDRPVSYILGKCVNGILSYDHVGYDPFYKEYSPGTVLMYLTLEHLFEQESVSVFDFTEGEGAHKELFATNKMKCADLYFFPSKIKNYAFILVHFSFHAVFEGISDLTEKLRLKKTIRNWIRRNYRKI